MARLESQGGRVENAKALIEAYREKFGLDKPILLQYGLYLSTLPNFDLGYSISFFPTTVTGLIARHLPWTVGLLLTTLFFSFAIGSILGALMVWPRSAGALKVVAPFTMVMAAIPYYLMALLLLWGLAFTFSIFPIFGAKAIGSELTGFARFRRNTVFLDSSCALDSHIEHWTLGRDHARHHGKYPGRRLSDPG